MILEFPSQPFPNLFTRKSKPQPQPTFAQPTIDKALAQMPLPALLYFALCGDGQLS